jgi:putative GTP pyrophosphokinase
VSPDTSTHAVRISIFNHKGGVGKTTLTMNLASALAHMGKLVDLLVGTYERHQPQISLFREQLLIALSSSSDLTALVHSMRSRLKDPQHLRDKLKRKLLKCRESQEVFDVTPESLLVKINDLVGVRVLHLYTRQIRQIDASIREILQEAKYELIEGPSARTWDDESRSFFNACGIATQESPSMYTSVHYVIGSASKTKVTAEIQVRTLMEEVWGEVDHTVNYPIQTPSLPCSEQIKVLARITSSASRLVDSIFATVDDHRRGAAETNVKLADSAPKRKRSTR